VFAGLIVRFSDAIRAVLRRDRPPGGPEEGQSMTFWPEDDERLDDGGLAGSRVPRRPPDVSGSGAVALVELTPDEGLDAEDAALSRGPSE
jgi:hypothetical protein